MIKKDNQSKSKKRGVIRYYIHEELHAKNWDKPEKWIRKKTDKVEQKLTISKAINLLKKYKNG